MGKQVNIPKLRFSEFSNEWRIRRFDELFLFSTGKNIKQNEASPEFETPCVRYGELYHMYNEVIYEVVNKTNLDRSELLFSDGDEILLPSAGEDPLDIGSASALTIRNVAIGRTINILKPANENIYSQIFVAYYINHKLKKEISKLAKGVSISNVYNSDLKTLEIMLPSLPEQQKIASFLTAVDDKLQALKKKKSLLDHYKKGVMQNIFSQEFRFKDDDGSEFPEWEEMKLGSLLIECNEKTKNSNQHKILSSTAKGLFNQDEYFTRDIASKDNTGYKILRKGQLVFSPQNLWLGNINVNLDFEIGIVSPSYKIFSFNEKFTSAKYCQYFLLMPKMMFAYEQSSVQGASVVRRNLDMDKFMNIDIQMPSLHEQTKIANFISAIDEKINGVSGQIEKMEVWKKGLLQKMFV
jgi:type I restriction enzyme, S subunit